MTLSVITPVHAKSAQFLQEAYDSLLSQTFADWEWVIVLNNGGTIPFDASADLRIKVFAVEDDDPEHNRIGRLKRFACEMATGEIYVELDADDILVPNALEDVAMGFADSATAMVYSNSASFKTDTWESPKFDAAFGWQYRPFFWGTNELNEAVAWPCSPQMMRFIFWAPDHIRAWRAAAYNAIGGHDQAIKTGDDHDLCCRFLVAYGAHSIKHIDKCLYLYRLHETNSCVVHNDEVQEQTLKNYLKYSRPMAVRWAKDEGLDLLDLGGRLNAWDGFKTVDLMDSDVIADLQQPWPFDDNSVGVIRASHVFEHLRDPIHAMNEAFRVLAPGGWLLIEVPSTDGRGAFQDPTHVSFWNENSIWYYTKKEFARFVPAFNGRFQNSRTVTYFPSEFERIHNIPVVQSDLIALKGDYARRPVGEVHI
jgi:glycosyltransferase involved in cell wall biosynthesis